MISNGSETGIYSEWSDVCLFGLSTVPGLRLWTCASKEHLHIGLHLTDDRDRAFTEQCAKWFGDRVKEKSPAKDVVAESFGGAWQVKHCLKGGKTGPQIAAYLGKDEPEFTYTAWGKRKPNLEKRNSRHSASAGQITGLQRHTYRHGTSRNISPTSSSGKAILALATDEERMIGTFERLPF